MLAVLLVLLVAQSPAPQADHATWVTEREGPGGFMAFSGVQLRVQFDEQPPLTLNTIEETPSELAMAADDKVSLVTTVLDAAKGLVRVRVMRNAVRARPGLVKGDVIEELLITLGQTRSTTRLGRNAAVTVASINGHAAR